MRRGRTIYTEAYVGDVDVEVSVDDLLMELSDEEFLEEMKDRGLSFRESIPRLYELEGDKLYRILCDINQVGYHTDKSEVLKLLAKKF